MNYTELLHIIFRTMFNILTKLLKTPVMFILAHTSGELSDLSWIPPTAAVSFSPIVEWPKNTDMLPITLPRKGNLHRQIQGSSTSLETHGFTLIILLAPLTHRSQPSQASINGSQAL